MKLLRAISAFLPQNKIPVLVVTLLFLTALFWAKARDPFRRLEFSVKTADGSRADAIAVMPKSGGPFPTVVYLYGANGAMIRNGKHLRQFAELGMAAVCLEYSQKNWAIFEEQFKALSEHLSRQAWADTNHTAWVGSSLGAQRMLAFALQHPEYQPGLMVRLSGGLVSELDEFAAPAAATKPLPLHCRFLLVQAEKDETFTLEDNEHLAALLRTNGLHVDLRLLPGLPHKHEEEHPLVTRLTAEYCKTFAAPDKPVVEATQNYVARHYGYWITLLVLGLSYGGYRLRQTWRTRAERPSLTRFDVGLRVVAAGLALVAAGETVFHLITPRLAASPRTISVAAKYLVPQKEQADFAFVSTNCDWRGWPLRRLLQQAQLAGYNRTLVNWTLPDDVYRNYVLSPVLGDTLGEAADWRRTLWENFYPRIRKETAPAAAARVIVRFLRERVTVTSSPLEPADILSSWNRGYTDAAGFERLYVAALRSAGIPARQDAAGQAQIWSGNDWEAAPRPLVSTFL